MHFQWLRDAVNLPPPSPPPPPNTHLSCTHYGLSADLLSNMTTDSNIIVVLQISYSLTPFHKCPHFFIFLGRSSPLTHHEYSRHAAIQHPETDFIAFSQIYFVQFSIDYEPTVEHHITLCGSHEPDCTARLALISTKAIS